MILAPYDLYYSDCGLGSKIGTDSWCDPYKTFWYIYQFEPSEYINDENVLGGEVPAWAEMANDWNIHARMWPRITALVDRLWSPLVPIDLKAIALRQTAFASYL